MQATDIELEADFLNRLQGEVVCDVLDWIDRDYICTDTLVVRKDVFSEVGLMDRALRTGEDLDMWIRIAARHPRMGYSIQPAAIYHRDVPDSLSRHLAPSVDGSAALAYYDKQAGLSATLAQGRSKALLSTARGGVKNHVARLALAGHAELIFHGSGQLCDILGWSVWLKYAIAAVFCRVRWCQACLIWWMNRRMAERMGDH